MGSSAGRIGLAFVGAAIGTFAGPEGTLIGFSLGYTLGGFIFPPKLPDSVGPQITDSTIQTSTYGTLIPILWGQQRLAGNIIWASVIRSETNTSGGGGGKGGGSGGGETTYTYFRAVAIALCQGPILSVDRIWANTGLIWDGTTATYPFTLHLGDETQIPSSIMESYDGAGNIPAYRGIAYIEFDNFPLSDFSNTLPQFSFEVTAS